MQLDMQNTDKKLTSELGEKFKTLLQARFEKNMNRHQGLTWEVVSEKLDQYPRKLWSLSEMEKTGGEPDVVGFNQETKEVIFVDCSKESPMGRRNLCYDGEALASRKEHKPAGSATDMAAEMEIEILGEEGYRKLQTFGDFDTKTSSWLKTPAEIRTLGGAIFGDYRYKTVFIYHNGAESYYGVRGFRGLLKV